MLWCNQPSLPAGALEEHVAQRFPSHVFEVLMFENPQHLRSVPDVSHGHVLVRRRRPDSGGDNGRQPAVVMEVCVDSVASARAAKAGGEIALDVSIL